MINASLLLAGLLPRSVSDNLSLWGGKSALSRRVLHKQGCTLATQLAAAAPATLDPAVVHSIVAHRGEEWFAVEFMRMRSFVCGALIGWLLSVIEEFEFFVEWPEAKEADDELRRLRSVEAELERRRAPGTARLILSKEGNNVY